MVAGCGEADIVLQLSGGTSEITLKVADSGGQCTDPDPTLQVGSVKKSVAVYDTLRATPLTLQVQYEGSDAMPATCEEIDIGLGSGKVDVDLEVKPCEIAVAGSCPTCG